MDLLQVYLLVIKTRGGKREISFLLPKDRLEASPHFKCIGKFILGIRGN